MALNFSISDLIYEAQKQYLLEGKTEFKFPLRKPPHQPKFYEEVDFFITQNSWIQIQDYRNHKEGFVNVSRPSQIGFALNDLLRLNPSSASLKGKVEGLIKKFFKYNSPQFIQNNYSDFLNRPDDVLACFTVFDFLMTNQTNLRGLLPRQIPHGQSTKLIGREILLLKIFSHFNQTSSAWKDFYKFFGLLSRPLEYRFYAPTCSYQKAQHSQFYGLLTVQNKNEYSFSSLNSTLIVENLEIFYRYKEDCKQTLLIDGGGWKASLLVSFLDQLPQPIFYWGDIDKEGLEIFSYLKTKFPPIQPLFMNFQTLNENSHLIQKKSSFKTASSSIHAEIKDFYSHIVQNEIQIEQEQLNKSWPFLETLI